MMAGRDPDVVEVNASALSGAVVDFVAAVRCTEVAGREFQRVMRADSELECITRAEFELENAARVEARAAWAVARLLYTDGRAHRLSPEFVGFIDALLDRSIEPSGLVADDGGLRGSAA